MQLGVALAAVGKQPQAVAELEAVISDQPDNAEAHYQLGRLYTRLGERTKAREHLLTFQRLRRP
jgi:Flp pilus assembly protein TadD